MMRDQASAPEATDIGLATYGDVLSASGDDCNGSNSEVRKASFLQV